MRSGSAAAVDVRAGWRVVDLPRRLLVIAAVAVVALDTATKYAAVWLGDVHVNQGVAFGMLDARPAVAFALAVAMTIAVSVMAWRWCHGPLWALGWGLVVGGAVGNLLDRLTPPLGVVDWIHVAVYPAFFNLADVAVRSGGLVLIALLVAGGLGEWRRTHIGLSTHGGAGNDGQDSA